MTALQQQIVDIAIDTIARGSKMEFEDLVSALGYSWPDNKGTVKMWVGQTWHACDREHRTGDASAVYAAFVEQGESLVTRPW